MSTESGIVILKTLLMTILNNVYDMGKTDTSQYLIFVHSTSKSLIVSLHALNKTLDVFAELEILEMI